MPLTVADSTFVARTANAGGMIAANYRGVVRASLPSISDEATLWVDGDNGSDAADGSSYAEAFSTIQRALYAAQPGDIIYIVPRAGGAAYIEDTQTSSYASAYEWQPNVYASLHTLRSGTALQPIVITSPPGEAREAIIDCENTRAGLLISDAQVPHSYIEVRDLTFRNIYNCGVGSLYGQRTEVRAGEVGAINEARYSIGCVVSGCHFDGCGGAHDENPAPVSPWTTVDWVVENNLMEKNQVIGANKFTGVLHFGAVNLIVRQNTILDCRQGVNSKDHFVQQRSPVIHLSEVEVTLERNFIDAEEYAFFNSGRPGPAPPSAVKIRNNIMRATSTSNNPAVIRSVSDTNYVTGGDSTEWRAAEVDLENNVLITDEAGSLLHGFCVYASRGVPIKARGNILVATSNGAHYVAEPFQAEGEKAQYDGDYNVFAGRAFRGRTDIYEAGDTTRDLTQWRALTTANANIYGETEPNSIEDEALADLFTDPASGDWTLKAGSAALGFMPDGSNAGAYQNGDEQIGHDW